MAREPPQARTDAVRARLVSKGTCRQGPRQWCRNASGTFVLQGIRFIRDAPMHNASRCSTHTAQCLLLRLIQPADIFPDTIISTPGIGDQGTANFSATIKLPLLRGKSITATTTDAAGTGRNSLPALLTSTTRYSRMASSHRRREYHSESGVPFCADCATHRPRQRGVTRRPKPWTGSADHRAGIRDPDRPLRKAGMNH